MRILKKTILASLAAVMLLTMTVVNTQAAKRLIKSEAAEKTFRSVTLVVG